MLFTPSGCRTTPDPWGNLILYLDPYALPAPETRKKSHPSKTHPANPGRWQLSHLPGGWNPRSRRRIESGVNTESRSNVIFRKVHGALNAQGLHADLRAV